MSDKNETVLIENVVPDNHVLRISRKKKTIPLIIEDEEGNEGKYELRELSGPQRDKYLNTMASKARLDNKGRPVGLKTMDGIQSLFLSMSLFDSDGKNLTEKQINEVLPSSGQQVLFKKALELSGLGETAEVDAKNE